MKSTLPLFFLLSLCSGFPLRGEQTEAISEDPPAERVTEITSDHLLFDYGNKIAVFTGNVVVTDPDMNITAETLTIHLGENDEVTEIVARGNVVIKMEGMHSLSGVATFTSEDQKLVLEENPQVFREANVLTGTKIIYFRAEDRMEAERARVLNFEDAARERNRNF